jgi:hypothetical protein
VPCVEGVSNTITKISPPAPPKQQQLHAQELPPSLVRSGTAPLRISSIVCESLITKDLKLPSKPVAFQQGCQVSAPSAMPHNKTSAICIA